MPRVASGASPAVVSTASESPGTNAIPPLAPVTADSQAEPTAWQIPDVEVHPKFLKLVNDNAELRSETVAAAQALIQADIKLGELEGQLRVARKLLCQTTRYLARSVDALRSASTSAHKAEFHGGSYEKCRNPVCLTATEMWEHLGGLPGMTLALEDPEEYWIMRALEAQQSGESLLAEEEAPAEDPEEESDLEEPTVGPQTVEVDPKDMGWAPKWRGTTGRMISTPTPGREKDGEDPGTLAKIKART